MALLTDGNPNDDEDLQAYETSIFNVANVEGINLDTKLTLATEEIVEVVLDVLLDHAWTLDPQTSIRRRIGVSDVVVSPQMTRWHAFHSLELVYRDAFNNQLNDRYQAKWREYQRLSRNAQEDTMRFGIGLALTPIPQASQPTFVIALGTNPATIYYVQVSWVAANGEEGEPSSLTTYQTADSSNLALEMGTAPAVATAFNVYAGLSATTLALQNTPPIPIGQSFVLASTGLVPGNAPGNGQLADVFITGGRLLRRG
jgi:hypothetical protein